MTPTPASSSRSRSSVPSPADDGPFGGASSPDRLAPFGPEQRPRILAALETDAEIQAAIAVEAAASGESTAVLAARVRTYADEIVPQFNARRHHRLAYRLARRLATLLFRVRVGHVDEGVIIDIPPDASVVFVINHRSNIDYVLVAFLAAEHVAISFAVGEWARVWPLDSLVRSLGAFFVRRDSRNRLYRKVLERYVYLAVTHGVTQAVFMEGGLSRDGRLRPPKFGLLSYLTRHMRRDSARDVVFVPVAVNYDRVLEDRHLLRDLEPEAGVRSAWRTAAVGLAWLLKNVGLYALRRLYRFGYACVNFGPPISLADYLCARGIDLDALDEAARFAETERLALTLMDEIAQVVEACGRSTLKVILETSELETYDNIRAANAIEIKGGQGAKPGLGGTLPGTKVTPEIAQIRGIPEGRDSISPNRHRDIANVNDLLDMVVQVRDLTGRPVGVKTAIGGWKFMNDLARKVDAAGK